MKSYDHKDCSRLVKGEGGGNLSRKCFKKRSREEMINYIEDLEHTLSISKQLIIDLVNGIEDEKVKEGLDLLMRENAMLKEKLATVVAERNLLQKRIVFARDKAHENKPPIERLQEETSRQLLLKTHKDLCKAVNILKKYAAVDQEAKNLLEKLDIEIIILNKEDESNKLKGRLVVSENRLAEHRGLIDAIMTDKPLVEELKQRQTLTYSQTEPNESKSSPLINSLSPTSIKKVEGKKRNARSLGTLISKSLSTELIVTQDIVNFSFA